MISFIFFIICSVLGLGIGAGVGIHIDNSMTPDCWYGLLVGVLIGLGPATLGESIDIIGDIF